MKTCRIVRYAHIPEAAEMLKYSLEELGVSTIIEIGNDYTRDDKDFTIVIRALKDVFPDGLANPKILFQTEELWNRRARGHYDVGGRFARVLEMFEENCKIPRGTGNVKHCPVGYTPTYSMGLPEPDEQDIDVFFFGSMTDRRKQIGAELIKRLPQRRIVFSSNAWFEEKEKLIMRSKIILNIKAHDLWGFTPMHNLPAIANKRLCLIEKPDGEYGIFKKGKHFKEYNGIGQMVDQIEYWLQRDKERKEFAVSALEDVKENCQFTPILQQAMKGFI